MTENTVHIAGIDLPKQLYDAANNDSLAIFIGAGVSLPSKIPNFDTLTSHILKETINNYKQDLTCSEKLERGELDGINIRNETKRIINERNTGPADTHHCLIEFFRKKTMRLVTTNFDLNLSISAEKKKIPYNSYFQPALPRGDLFNGIVYLHGAISQEEGTLIITEKDFAHAYLKYGRQTAFIRELFSKFTVLFIGYSYDDKIFQFLTKSDDFQSKRYVFVSDTVYQSDPQKWDVLNLTAIPYNTENNHKQLWQVVKTWGDLTNLKPAEHLVKIKHLARKRRELTPEESDYLKCCLDQDQLAECFFQHAKSERWLEWAYNQNFLSVFFNLSFQPTELQRLTIVWFCENFVTHNYKTALQIIQEQNPGNLNPYLIDMIALALHRSKRLPPRIVFFHWVQIILSAPNYLPKDHICRLILKCKIPQDLDIVILLLNKLTSPTGRPEEKGTNSNEYWIKYIWEKHFKPKIATIATEIEPLICHQLKLHEIQERTRQKLDNTVNSSIEYTTAGNLSYSLINVLSNIARDIIDYFIQKQSRNTTELIKRWYQQKTIVLKRLSIYAVAKHKTWSASKKLGWLLARKDLFNQALSHENFGLIKSIYNLLSDVEKKRLIKAAHQQGKDEHAKQTFIAWLNKLDSNNPDIVRVKMAQSRAAKQASAYKVVNNNIVSSLTGISPVSHDKLLQMNATEIIELLTNYKDEKGIGKPKRKGLIIALSKAANDNFKWSLCLAKNLSTQHIYQQDIWHCLLFSWNKNQALDIKQANAIIKFMLEQIDIQQFDDEIAIFLAKHSKKLYKTESYKKQSEKLALRIRDQLLAKKPQTSILKGDDIPDWWAEATNSSGHFVCDFLIQLYDKKYRNSPFKNKKLYEFFIPFIIENSHAAQMGKITLSYYLPFFYTINKPWTQKNILPLFDWTIDKTNALQAWQAYLYQGKWNKALFEDLIAIHLKTFTHFKGLGKSRENYCRHIAGLTLYCIIFDSHNPLKTGWLRAFINHCEETDLEAFTEGIYTFLRDNKEVQKNSTKVWTDLLLPYIDQRIAGIPKPLCRQEFTWILKWCLHLKTKFHSCANKIIEADKKTNLLGIDQTQHTDIFYKFKDSAAFRTHPKSAGELVLHLLTKKHISLWDWEDLKETMQVLQNEGCSMDTLKKIKKASQELGFNDA